MRAEERSPFSKKWRGFNLSLSPLPPPPPPLGSEDGPSRGGGGKGVWGQVALELLCSHFKEEAERGYGSFFLGLLLAPSGQVIFAVGGDTAPKSYPALCAPRGLSPFPRHPHRPKNYLDFFFDASYRPSFPVLGSPQCGKKTGPTIFVWARDLAAGGHWPMGGGGGGGHTWAYNRLAPLQIVPEQLSAWVLPTPGLTAAWCVYGFFSRAPIGPRLCVCGWGRWVY